MKQTNHPIKSHRYELVHGEDADFIAYQRKFGDGLWQTVSAWMIPRVRSIGSRSLLEGYLSLGWTPQLETN
jgi:hypothetical protein